MKQEIIIGTHSIIEALKNQDRGNFKLIATDDGLDQIKKGSRKEQNLLDNSEVTIIKSKHDFQNIAAKHFSESGFKPTRVMNGAFLLTNPKSFIQVGAVFDGMKSRSDMRIVCLDQVTDPQNAAAVVRTAAFYGVDYLMQ